MDERPPAPFERQQNWLSTNGRSVARTRRGAATTTDCDRIESTARITPCRILVGYAAAFFSIAAHTSGARSSGVHAETWRELGVTDLTVDFMGAGFATLDQHLDVLQHVAEQLALSSPPQAID